MIESLAESLASKDRQIHREAEQAAQALADATIPKTETPNALSLRLLPIIQQHSGERGQGETAEQTLLRIVRERDESKKLLGELLAILGKHVGETGVDNERPVDVLNRLIEQRDVAHSKLAAIALDAERPLAKASSRRRRSV